MSHNWKQWEGQVVNGEYTLLRYIGGSEGSAVFLTEFRQDDRLQKAAIKLVPAGEANDEQRLSRWQAAAELPHPHLIPLFDGGRCEIGGVPALYVVMECAEENLAQVLPNRALTPVEAREMLDSVLDVLTFLHGKGYVHGDIKPANIMADEGDHLKLSSDGIRRVAEALERPGRRDDYDPPENAPEAFARMKTTSTAGDVWSVGMAIVETMTRTLVATSPAEQREPLVPLTLPEPFLDIARHCLLRHPQDRWTVAQIAARLQGRTPAPVVRGLSRASQSEISRSAGLPGDRRGYGIPLTAGIVLALVAIVAVPRLRHRHSDAPPAAAAVVETPALPAAPKEVPPAPRERPSETSKPVVKSGQDLEGRAPMPAIAHSRNLSEETTDVVATLPAVATSHGEVAKRVLPDVLDSARKTIRGTVKVAVKVDVDRSGNVEGTEVESRGPSRYFERAALQAAPRWTFKPPMVGGRGVISTWTLRFEFTRGGTNVVPTQEIP